MADIHVTKDLLLGIYRGELPTTLLAQVSLHHLQDLCPRCRAEIEDFQRQMASESSEADSEVVLAVLAFQVARLQQEQQQEQRRAERDLRELLALPVEERHERVRRARTRFRGGLREAGGCPPLPGGGCECVGERRQG